MTAHSHETGWSNSCLYPLTATHLHCLCYASTGVLLSKPQ